MDDEFALRRAQDRAARVESLLRDGELKAAFDRLKAGYVEAWVMTDPRDKEGREMAWMARTLVEKVERDLATVVTDGKIASHQLAVMENRRQA